MQIVEGSLFSQNFPMIKVIFLALQQGSFCVYDNLESIEQHNLVQSFFPSHIFWSEMRSMRFRI